jgi:hypothetical protein
VVDEVKALLFLLVDSTTYCIPGRRVEATM